MERKESTWVTIDDHSLLAEYGVTDPENVVRAFARIMQFESQFSFSQRLDIVVHRNNHIHEYFKYKIVDDAEETAVKEAIPGIKTLFRQGV